MSKYTDARDMKRALYYASKGIHTAYTGYKGEHVENVKDLLAQVDNLYIALKREEEHHYVR